MKRTVPRFFALAVTPLLLALTIPVVHADGYYIHIGDSGYGFKSHSGHRTYGPATSFGHTYGPVTSLGGQHRLDGRNRFNLNSTRDRHRSKRFHHKKHGSDFQRGFRRGFREGLRQNRSLHERRFGNQSLHDRRFNR